MGCCGQNKKTRVYQKAQKLSASPIVGRSKHTRQPHGTIHVGSKCRYCGTTITEKLKKTIRGWQRTGWCSKCKLEA